MSVTAKPLLILGARAFAREIADIVSEIPTLELKGFVENTDPARCGGLLEGLPVYWVEELASLAAAHWGVCAFGSTRRSAFVSQAVAYGMRFATVVHPSARVSSRSVVGEGTMVCPGVQVGSHTQIGPHVILNKGAIIGHDVEIGQGATVGPGVNVAGFCRIGVASYIGIGATLVDRISVGCGVTIAAGSVVTRDVPDRVMVAGVPAVIVKQDVEPT